MDTKYKKDLEKDIKILNKAINQEYSLNYMLELYKSDKHSYFYFSKKNKIIAIIIFIIILIFGLINYSIITIIIGILGTGYPLYSLGMVKGYDIGAFDGIDGGFEQGMINNELFLLKLLLKYKNKKYKKPEESIINILLGRLNKKISDLYDKDGTEYKIAKIVQNEKRNYSTYNMDDYLIDLG